MKTWQKMHTFNCRLTSPGAKARVADVLDDTQVGVQRIFPLNYSTMHLPPIVGVCQENVKAGDRLAVLPLNSPVVAAVREMEGLAVPMQGNVKTTIIMCQCGSLHALLHSSADLCQWDILVPKQCVRTLHHGAV